jgi:Aspartyl protease
MSLKLVRRMPVLAAVIITSLASATVPDCPLRRLASIDVQVDDHDRVLIPVILEGRPLLLALDLGQGKTTLNQSFVDDLKLSTTESKGFWVIDGRKVPSRVATFDSLTIGSARFEKGHVLIFPRPVRPPTSPATFAGFLSMDVLGSVDFELDLAHGAMRLYSQDHCPGAVVYWTKHYSSAHLFQDQSGSMFLPIALEGKQLEAQFSTLSADTTLHVDVTRRLYGFDESSPGNEIKQDPSGKSTTHFRAMRLTGEGLDAKNVDIELLPPLMPEHCSVRYSGGASVAGYSGCIGHPLAIGTRVLRQLRLYFATKEKVLYFSAADAGDGGVPGIHPADGTTQ